MSSLQRIEVIDTHTAGEPTRVVLAGGPDLGSGPLHERRQRFHESFDHYRAAIVNEPRGSDVMVGALLVPPHEPNCAAGVIFFNNVGMLGMCGHGTIGVVVALAHRDGLQPGPLRLDTPAGVVTAHYHGSNRVSIQNVPSYRHLAAVPVTLRTGQTIHGDVAWGGNWYFVCWDHGQQLSRDRAAELTAFAWQIRRQLAAQGVTGADGGEVNHVELIGPADDPTAADARNFVLCPGGAYDRSPCGTGTSAHLACLAAEGRLQPGQRWRQQSIIGSLFEGSYQWDDQGRIIPEITGTAYVTAEAMLLLDPADPYCWGIGQRQP